MNAKQIVGWSLGLVVIFSSGSARADEAIAPLAPASAPEMPSSPMPASGALNVATTAKLSWHSNGAGSYDVYFGTTNTPGKVANVMAATYAPFLQASTKYYWRIVARSERGGKTTGPLWSFTTSAAPAGAPTVGSPSPVNGATNVPAGSTLTWKGSGATLGYDFYFGTTPSPTMRGTTLSASWKPYTQPGMKYYWRVVARNSTASTTSPIWSFTTASSSSQPVDCVLSSWTLASASTWSTCSASGEQTRTEQWKRTIVVAPQNGGLACGPLSETRIATRSCSTLPPPPSSGLLSKSELVYEGAFRVPTPVSPTQSLNYGGTALSFWPAHNSLLLVGHDHYQLVGEISLPVPTQAATVGQLPQAAWRQLPTDILQGKRISGVDGGTVNGVKVGGITVVDPNLVVTAWTYYDAAPTPQTRTHFVTGQDFSAMTAVADAFQVGHGFQDYVPTDTMRIGGFVSGYMTPIPTEWQGHLGGTHLTGQGGGVAIQGRTSSGPSATVFTPTDLGGPNAVTNAHLVMGYPSNSGNPNSTLDQPTLGEWGVNGGLYNGAQYFRGMVFPDGTRSILYFGWGGSRFCYGAGTDDPSLDLQPNPVGGHYCYDPANGSKGVHGYPYRSIVYAYDVLDFIAAKQGNLKPWEVKPYATWEFAMPFQEKLDANGIDHSSYSIVGAAYDAATRRIFLTAYRTDGDAPLIHAFRVP